VTRGYETARITELERPDGWSPIRKQLGVHAFGVNAWTAHAAGAQLIPAHDEKPSGHEELYVVLTGRATFTVDAEEIDAEPGTIVFVRDPALQRGAVATEAGTTLLAVGGRVGDAYRPRSWETNVDVFRLFGEERYDEIKELILANMSEYEDQGALLYNLACAEARLGNTDAAFDYLRSALEHRPDLAPQAPQDDDLASLRDDPRFKQIFAG
jgi:quercetin dioxygenase-like cupin family protein